MKLTKKRLKTSTPSSAEKVKNDTANTVLLEHHKEFDSIFKPLSGEGERIRGIEVINPEVKYYKREVLAYELDCLFGFKIVPITVIAKSPGSIGSRQLWVDGKGDSKFTAKRNDPEGVVKMIVFDIICGNTDRHRENYLYDSDSKKVWAIDHGLCFSLNNSEFFCTFVPYKIQDDIRNGNMKSSKQYFKKLPVCLQNRIRAITKEQFMFHFSKHGLKNEGDLAWARMQEIIAA